MQDLAKDLKQIEYKAAEFYHAMAANFKENTEISSALERFAQEEEEHGKIMDIIAACAEEGNGISCLRTVNPSTQYSISIAMDSSIEHAKAGSLTLQELGEAIIAVEFSEWNSLFFYVVNTLKNVRPECKIAAIKMQEHIRALQQFLNLLPLDRKILERLRNLPPLWCENILVIDDDASVLDLLKAVLRKTGNVDVALDGTEGLEKIRQKYYALVISDLNMPKVDGIQLYKKMHDLFPSINRRFLFFSGTPSDDQLSFVREHHLKLIEKPAMIKDIIAETSAVLSAGIANLN
jgi:two-component system chemotaxis response regulator CheY